MKEINSIQEVDFELMLKSIKRQHPDGHIPITSKWNKECLGALVDAGLLTKSIFGYSWKIEDDSDNS
jgi:hypothetical protein